jgi:hypothetical protein
MQTAASPAAPLVSLARPEGLGAAVWIVVGMSALLAFSALGLLAGDVANEKLRTTMAARLPGGPEGTQAEQFLTQQRRIADLARPAHAMSVGALSLAAAIWGGICAFRLHKRRADAVPLFSAAAIAIVAMEGVSAVQGVQLQQHMRPLMTEIMNNLERVPHRNASAPMLNMISGALSGVSTVAIFTTIGWAAAKIVVCLYALHCARTPAVRAWIASAAD